MKLYSIIIPHHNTPDLLNRCLNSIPQRDDLEIIVIDDNSRPERMPNINRLDVHLIKLDAVQSKGAGHARNVALEKAQGKWVLFADADDYYIDGFLSILDLYVNDDIDVLYFGYNFLDGNNKILNNTIETCQVISLYEDTKYNSDRIRYNNYAPWSKMVRRSYIDKYTIRFEEVKNGNDILFSLLIASFTTKFKVDKRPIYAYIKTENSLTTQKLSTSAHMCRIEHYIKLAMFYRHKDRPEWTTSCFKYIFYVLKTEGLKKFIFLSFAFIKSIPNLYKTRNEFIYLTTKR